MRFRDWALMAAILGGAQANAERGLADDVPSVSMSSGPAAAAPHVRHVQQHHRAAFTGGGHSWGATAVTLANGGVSSGYARGPTPAAAIANAIAKCAGMGRPGCYVPNPAFSGCGYVTISQEGTPYSAWGTGGTPQAALDSCLSQGVSCLQPIGGCP